MSLPSNSKRKIFDGRYEILSIVGRGADSVVYHARHITGAAQEVAIKVLINRDGTTTLTDKLRREALTLVSCRHRYVVRLDDFHSIQDLCYLSMEYAAKGDLSKFIASLPEKKLPAEQIGVFLKQALEALDFVHATGVIHRDIKPENILVLNEKEIRLADFGLALLPGDEVLLDELRNAVGSFDYLAPEVLDGVRYDTISDLYSLGVCFYEAATGKHPFSYAPIAERREARREPRIVPLQQAAPQLPSHIAAVITTLMRFSPEDRLQSASEALRALENPSFEATGVATAGPESSRRATPANDDLLQSESQYSSGPAAVVSSSGQTVAGIAAALVEPAIEAASESANSDPVPPAQSSPTEKIDLERIKAIIAKDTQRRSEATGNTRSSPSNYSQTDLSDNNTDLAASSEAKTKADTGLAVIARDKGRSKSGAQAMGRSGVPLIFKALMRFVGVALAFALLTVGGMYGYHHLFKKGSKSKINATNLPATTVNSENSEPDTSAGSDGDQNQSPAVPLRELPEGLYPGTIQGLFAGAPVPMALIVDPKQQQLALLIGLDGWTPATAPLSSENGLESEGPTFRANGLILKFNQESSSGSITGTVIDVVSGDTGTWKLTK